MPVTKLATLVIKTASADDPAFKAAIKTNKELRSAYLAAQVANGGNLTADQVADLAKKHGVKLTAGHQYARPGGGGSFWQEAANSARGTNWVSKQRLLATVPDLAIGGAVGALRTSKLKEKDKAVLTKEYGLPDDANLRTRNAGRGMVGMFGGAAIGEVIGKGLLRSRPSRHPLTPGIGALVGGLTGLQVLTDKYSKRNADRIIVNNFHKGI